MAKREKPRWTIMVYLAGDNNLTTNCISVLQQLESVKYLGEDVCVLACFDSNTPAPKGARYLAINCKRNKVDTQFDWEIHNDLISPDMRGPDHTIDAPDFCKPDSKIKGRNTVYRPVVAEGLKRFINWAVEHHKESERYMLILYGHGPVVAGQTFLAKENPPSSLRLEDLQGVLNRHFGRNRKRKIDILACQNCVMNGIETAYELKHHANFMIGSQGLVLAQGWPYEKMIGAVVEDPSAATPVIARKLLKACARHMLDFVVMDRSSEQSLCDLRCLRENDNLTTAIRNLVIALKRGLQFDRKNDDVELRYPSICNAVRLARLETQSYWGETFVDLFDFCDRLIKSCRDVDAIKTSFLEEMGLDVTDLPPNFKKLAEQINRIVSCCLKIQHEVRKTIPESFYIGSELQYSYGLSIYFPWSLPGAPYFFKSRGTQGKHYSLKTAFETYRGYTFVESSRWDDFLKTFFQATLRNVRRAPRSIELKSTSTLSLGLVEDFEPQQELITIDLQKSSSDTGKVDHEIWSNVKNYPRRNYLSPADCPRKIETAGSQKPGSAIFRNPKSPPVSYLGWNISGLVAEAIAPKPKTEPGQTAPFVSLPATNGHTKRNGNAATNGNTKYHGTVVTNGHRNGNEPVVVVKKVKKNNAVVKATHG
jgi:Clostripain family